MKTKLVQIHPPAFDVEIDIRYATANNFTGKPVYSKPLAFLAPEAIEPFKKAIELAKELGYRLRVFDAFRPKEAQMALWHHTPDPEFISHPETGSCPHCRGVAVDLTLLDKQGNELDMGTGFDAFTPKSHHGNLEVSKEAQRNRYLLMGIMTTAGWDFYRNEWWHYQLFEARKYTLFTDKDAGTGMM